MNKPISIQSNKSKWVDVELTSIKNNSEFKLELEKLGLKTEMKGWTISILINLTGSQIDNYCTENPASPLAPILMNARPSSPS